MSVRVDYPTTGSPPMIGVGLTIGEWLEYVERYDFGPLPPTELVLHHTYIPNEKQWRGLTSMRGMQRFYAGKGWGSAPHIYVGPDQKIWLFTPMYNVGIHAGTGNSGRVNGKFWYSVGIEMVGFFDDKRPSGAVWEGTKAVLGGLCRRLNIRPEEITFHRDYTNQKSCPGWAVTHDWVHSEVAQWLGQAVPERIPLLDANTTLLHAPRATAAQCAQFLIDRRHDEYTSFDIERVIVPQYFDICTSVGLDPLVVIAQMAHETGHLSSFWSARPQRNPAGLGVNGRHRIWRVAGDTRWAYNTQRHRYEYGLSFADWQTHSIPAHVGRLLAYALKDHEATPEQRKIIAKALSYRSLPTKLRGSAKTLKPLGRVHNPTGQGWASPGTNYGGKIADAANAILSVR
ncbi:MAG: N-acetylmuramoyl-L-alanine amidase [Chloroflexi bacterium AL-W]|nr:N-acetylmuramoyl-L-alanine amidase [Chloroflexi bacterium AL-N1]NOK64474.1 N-acetylmuramoyl-L-alanine amidase [Chloroflexi bacterium AL-N10]NOK75716.1 N-acetylmuramoyl-L-alanine amidase [Chloroflexi bacterium AL-N5]NOK80526.1 N-acetylmuramoyl-L-alanine amidase [Chloroflexi bacterium AL-W]NOK87040.1 N-acetylmuramoyl-L-alanine amidase [Chloroflexi bacterium AL-N15]